MSELSGRVICLQLKRSAQSGLQYIDEQEAVPSFNRGAQFLRGIWLLINCYCTTACIRLYHASSDQTWHSSAKMEVGGEGACQEIK